jgi:hypothetical protein
MKPSSRDDFPPTTKRALAQRVGHLCSNPLCRAQTTGPQADPAKSINVGVAAHITAAASRGPRFNPELDEPQRKNATNGIWLCQNCAKLIDSDPSQYTSPKLRGWKTEAEQEAKFRIGRTNSKNKSRSKRDAVSQLKRNHKMRDDLHRDLLKTPAERMRNPIPSSRIRKFAHGEVIIHRIGDTTYPNIDESPGISGWLKLETFDFYYGGLECILDLRYALLDEQSRGWAPLSHDQSENSFPDQFRVVKIFVTGKIPFRNIEYYDMRGDEYYPQPHLYCQYADDGGPYEGRGYYIVDEGDGYEFRLESDSMRAPEDLMRGVHEHG